MLLIDSHSQNIFPVSKKIPRVTAKFLVFSMSGKSKNQILCFPCAAATLILYFLIGKTFLIFSCFSALVGTLNSSSPCRNLLIQYLTYLVASECSRLWKSSIADLVPPDMTVKTRMRSECFSALGTSIWFFACN